MSNSRELSQSTVAFLRWITSATSHRWDSRRRTWCVSSMSISFEVVTGKRGWLVFKFEQFKNGIVRGRTIRFDYFVICDRLGACVGRPAGRFSCQHRRRHRTKAGKQGVKRERERERERGRTGKKNEGDFFCFVPFFYGPDRSPAVNRGVSHDSGPIARCLTKWFEWPIFFLFNAVVDRSSIGLLVCQISNFNAVTMTHTAFLKDQLTKD